MKTQLFSIILVIMLSLGNQSQLSSQTIVGGPIFSNTHWLVSGNPYQVTSSVQVPPGVTLTIDPGCVINITGEFEILVKGAIVAEGTVALPIQITGVQSQFRPVFMFRETNLSHCKLAYQQISGSGNKIAIQVGEMGDVIQPSGVLAVSHMTFLNSRLLTMGTNSGASVLIDSSSFSGGRVDTYHQMQTEPISMSACTFSGTNVFAGKGAVTLSNCVVQTSTLGGLYGPLQINGCTVDYSNIGGGGAPGLHMNKCTLNNSLVNAGPVNISDCIINTGSAYGVICGGGVIECTQLTGTGTGTGFEFWNGGQVNMYSCSVTSKSVGIWVRNVSSFFCDSLNIFDNAAYNVMNSTTSNLSMSNVYWGANDSLGIATKIYDYYDDITTGKLFYQSPRTTQYQSSSCAVTLTVPILSTSISEASREAQVGIYPNPAGSYIQLRYPNRRLANGEIINTEGKVVKHCQVSDTNSLIDVQDLPAGLYFVKIQGVESSTSGRFIKQ
jgi:hypothetical protein